MTNPNPDPNAEHLATIDWTRGKWSHVKGKYAREHTWHLAGGAKLKATDAPMLLPEGYRDKTKLNPENLFVATIASAHMLSWLHVAFQMELEVLSYRDAAHGLLAEISEGEYWVSEVILSPTVTFAAHQEVMPSALARIHELAHEQCFIARSIKTKVTVRSP
jgi:organic hydroperoxide reductase OsmC/OhrA